MNRISNKRTLLDWLEEDAKYYKYPHVNLFLRFILRFSPNPIANECVIWRYIKCLRYSEYHLNKTSIDGKLDLSCFRHSPYHSIMVLYYYYRLNKISYKTGFQIPPNVCGPGLNIYHFGSIIINQNVRIGKNATLYPGVLIGWKNVGEQCPIIGDNVFLGSGSKVIGNIRIGNNVTIGQNCVVVKDIPENSTVVASYGRII